MDYITTSKTVSSEDVSSEYESTSKFDEVSVRECEAHAHDRLLQLLITTEHHLVHAF